MSNKAACLTSKSDEWETPQAFFERLDRVWAFNIDAAATEQNAKCRIFFDAAADALAKQWRFGFFPEKIAGRVFMNPPYSRAAEFMAKAHAEVEAGNAAFVIALVAARVDTRWWHEYVIAPGYHSYPIRGRLKFGGKYSAPFPSAIVEMVRRIER